MPFSLADVWSAVGTGPCPWPEAGNWALDDVVVDSRLAHAGSLFVALPGERTDGHQFVGDAFRRGARAALVRQPVAEGALVLDVSQPAQGVPRAALTADARVCFVLPDPLAALQRLAAHWRAKQPGCRVVGVTGSVGKTSTKERVAAVLARRFVTLKSPGNYNNEIGLPLTILQLQPGVQWAVLEMAMYDLGEIARLAQIARPEIGVVTNVGPVHLQRLGSVERIAQAKAELLQALPPEGLAVLNGDDERVRAMAGLTQARVLTYGLQPHNDLSAGGVRTRGLQGVELALHWHGRTVQVGLPLLGRHLVYGALAAAAVGLHLGLGWDEVLAGLRDPVAQARTQVRTGVRGVTILDDTYNANPASTVAALDLLAEMPGRKVAVLGGMLELGSLEQEGHRQVGRRAAEVTALLVTVGKLGQIIADEARAAGMPATAVLAVADTTAAVAVLQQALVAGDFVLVKGSRGCAMENVVTPLLDPQAMPQPVGDR